MTITIDAQNVGHGYRLLGNGEKIQKGDQGYTWTNPDCTKVGWLTVGDNNVGEVVTDEVVPIRRKVRR
jgi:hypothetical protein